MDSIAPHPPSTRPPAAHGAWPLPADALAARCSRRIVQEQLVRWNLPDQLDAAELLVSELVGNALRHADGARVLRLVHLGGALRCEVEDSSPVRPRPRESASTDEDGRGLALLTRLATRWGSFRSPVGKAVWFEIDTAASGC
ncbi:ATP-binding protein [Kitasatospora sp. NPDC049258]|uniref:ATP-binding protein n=1 Tax=Kitasatospora sp. NPDC049258 TaxID=3155394 RepID=UPI00343ED5CA